MRRVSRESASGLRRRAGVDGDSRERRPLRRSVIAPVERSRFSSLRDRGPSERLRGIFLPRYARVRGGGVLTL